MGEKKEVSIIIPIYNGEKYLEECLDSVIKQDIEQKEIICIDDGSTDNTLGIVKRYQEKYSDIIKIIQQPNLGAAIARNNALNIAEGEYIAFMDSDDFYIDKTGLRKMICASKNNNIPICGSLRSVLTEKGMELADTYRAEMKDEEERIFRFADTQFDYYYQSYIFNRRFLNDNNLRFPNLRRYQDPPFFVNAMWLSKNFLVLPVELYCYRSRSENQFFSPVQVNDILKGILINIKFASRNGLKILYDNCVQRLNINFYNCICQSIVNNNTLAIRLLTDLQNVIDDNSLDKSAQKLFLIDAIQRGLAEYEYVSNEYLFPFNEIPYGSEVIIYGAGKVGKSIYYNNKYMRYCNVVKWVDKNYLFYQKQKISVEAPSEIQSSSARYIIIAVESKNIYMEILDEIKEQGQLDKKVIVGPIRKLC